MSNSKKRQATRIKVGKSAGIQITDDFIRYVLLGKKKDGIEILFSREIPLPAGVIVHGEIVKVNVLLKKLVQLRKECRSAPVHIVVPYNFVFDFILHEVTTDPAQVNQAISNYLHHSHRLNEEDFSCEYVVLESDRKKLYSEICVKCVSNEFIDAHTFVLKKAGFTPLSFKTSMRDIGRHLGQEQAQIIVDFGQEQTHASLVYKGFPITLECVDSGGGQCIPIIEKFLDISFEEAEKIHLEHGFLTSHHEQELLYKLLAKLVPCVEMLNKKHLDWHNNHSQNNETKLGEIMVHGECSDILGLADYLSQAIKSPVRNVDIHQDISHEFLRLPSIQKKHIHKFIPSLYAGLRGFVE